MDLNPQMFFISFNRNTEFEMKEMKTSQFVKQLAACVRKYTVIMVTYPLLLCYSTFQALQDLSQRQAGLTVILPGFRCLR